MFGDVGADLAILYMSATAQSKTKNERKFDENPCLERN